ncbi:hypothetical protein FB446DRAFT_764573 [Lentinula raphanica]|nr:hypothetical protein FB446DRAFT_764573 [Lentinula raphanica]
MLASAPAEAPANVTEDPAPFSAQALPQSSDSSLQPILDLIEASPEFKMERTFLTSPYTPYLDNSNTSPLDDSPFVADLDTPIMDHIDDIDYGVVDNSWMNDENAAPLFDEAGLSYCAQPAAQPEPKETQHLTTAAGPFDHDKLPFLDSFQSPGTQSYHTPAMNAPSSLYRSPLPTTADRPSLSATGTRRDITPASMARNYVVPSATSRKANPVHAQKRSHSRAFGDQEQDELTGESPPGPNATELEHIEWKRRQNTIAARKTRRRKLEHLQAVEAELVEVKEDRDRWKVRSGVLEGVLKANGLPVPNWDEDK